MSPGNGITPIPLSRDPLATEGEATPGPDDVNPFEEIEAQRVQPSEKTTKEDPAEGENDPFVFDDVGAGTAGFDLELPDLGGPAPDLDEGWL